MDSNDKTASDRGQHGCICSRETAINSCLLWLNGDDRLNTASWSQVKILAQMLICSLLLKS